MSRPPDDRGWWTAILIIASALAIYLMWRAEQPR